MAYSLGFAHGRITLSYNGGPAAAQLRADLLRAVASARAAHSAISGFGDRVNKLGPALASVAKTAAGVTAKVGGLVHAIVLAGTAAAQLAPILAAGFAVLPGLIVSGAVAMGVFKIATKGVGDALKAAGEDSKKFQEAIKGLAPQAQKFAIAWRNAGKSLAPVQRAMQDAFFNQTGPQITKIAKTLLGLKKEAVGVADGFNQVFRKALEFASSGTAIVTLRSVLNGVRGFLVSIAAGINPVLTGFFNLARQAGQFGDNLGKLGAGGLTKIGDFLNGINLESVLDGAAEALRPILQLLGDIGSIAASVFTGLSVGGTGTIGIFGELVSGLAAFLKTAEGTEALTALGTALSAIANATGQVFLTLLQELTPVIVALAPGIGELAVAVASVLVPALQIAGPLLAGIAGFLSANMNVIAPLIIGIYAVVGAMKAYAAITAAATAIQAAMNSAQVVAALAWVRTTAAIVANSVAQVYNRIVTLAGAAATAIASAATAIWGVITLIATSPITLIILAVIALIAVIYLIATRTTWFQTIWKYSWGAIRDAALAVWGWISGTLWPGIKAVFGFIAKVVQDNVRAMVQAFQQIWGAIQSVIGFFARLNAAAVQKFWELVAYVKGLPGQIAGALGNLGSLLYDKGKTLVEGFINGIKSMIGKLKDTAKNIASTVTDFLPGSPAKLGPLSGRGWTPFRGVSLVDGLMAGMASQIDDLNRMSVKVATAAVPVLPTMVMGAALVLPTLPPPTGDVGGTSPGVTFNQTVNALPGMSATQVANYSNQKMILGLRTGASVIVTEPDPAGV